MSGEVKNKQHYVIESKGYLYYVCSNEMRVADLRTLVVGDSVSFKNGKKMMQGKILEISESEVDADRRMRELSRLKETKPESSFHEERPRSAAIAQRTMMSYIIGSKSSAAGRSLGDKKSSTVKEATKIKTLHKKAEMIMQMDGEKGASKPVRLPSDNESDSSAESRSKHSDVMSTSSSLVEELQQVKHIGASADKQKLQELEELEAKEGSHKMIDMGTAADKVKQQEIVEDVEINKSCSQHNSKYDESINISSLHKREKCFNGIDTEVQENRYEEVQAGCSKTEGEDKGLKRKTDKSVDKKFKKLKNCDSPESLDDSEADIMTGGKEKDEKVKIQPNELKLSKKRRSIDSDDSSSKWKSLGKNNLKKSKNECLSTDSDVNSTEGESLEADMYLKKSKKKQQRSNARKKIKKIRIGSINDSDKLSDEEEKHHKKNKKPAKKKRKANKKGAKRNADIYEGQNYLYGSDTPRAIQLHEDFNVFVLKKDLDNAVRSKTASIFVRQMIDKIYTLDALQMATPQGFPCRGKGKHFYKGKTASPRLHPDGMDALAAKTEALELGKKSWRPRLSPVEIRRIISNKVSGFKTPVSDSSSSDDSSTDSSSDSSSSH